VNHPGWNPQQLVNRGVFDSLEEADAVLCRLDEARSRATITPESWRRGMAFDVPISRHRMVSGSAAGFTYPLQDGGPAAECLAGKQLEIACQPNSICPYCAAERAMNGQGSAVRTGFVAVARCERHAESSAAAVQPASLPHNPPGGAPAISRAATPGFPINPNAGVVQAFPKGRW